jgi:HSP20 family molecular chaperone IbpA
MSKEIIGSIMNTYFPEYRPFKPWQDYEKEFKLFDRFNKFNLSDNQFSVLSVEEKDGNHIYKFLCYGYEKEDLELKVNDEGIVLKIKNEKIDTKFTMPDNLDLSQLKAELKNGVLVITIPNKKVNGFTKLVKIN